MLAGLYVRFQVVAKFIKLIVAPCREFQNSAISYCQPMMDFSALPTNGQGIDTASEIQALATAGNAGRPHLRQHVKDGAAGKLRDG